MKFYDFVANVNAVLLEYNNAEGTISQASKNRFEYTYIGLCFALLSTVST